MPLPSAKLRRMKRMRFFLKIVVLLLAFLFFGVATAAAEVDKRKEFVLFGTKEFRSSIKSLPKWSRVVEFERGRATFQNFQGSRASEWNKLRARLENADVMTKAKEVNSFFNKWPYRTDMEAWGKSDYWATPTEFIGRSGDCEDFSIIKYYALKDLGVPVENMRIVILNDSIRNLDHAVLALDIEGRVYILDNVSNLVLPDSRLGHYKPYFSVNENFRWVHLPPDTDDPSKSVIKK